MTMDYVYRNLRPRLLVESKGGKKLGHCYSASYYTVTSTYPLTEANLQGLFASGAIGYGQEFRVLENGIASYDEVPCIGIDGDKVIENPINPYSGKSYLPTKLAVYVCKVETTCDSGD